MSRTMLVVLSGGADSTICLFVAKQECEILHAITFNYGQRHALEIESAIKIAEMAGCASHEIITLPKDILKSTSPLVSQNDVGHYESADKLPGGIEPTFIPCRNALFLTIAANRACALKANGIVTGVSSEDYGGYPDCRPMFIADLSAVLARGIYGTSKAQKHPIHTPLMYLSKAESVKAAKSLPGCWEALAFTTTSYDGDYPPNPFNHSSLLRAKGFHEAGLPDPLIERAIAEEKLPADFPKDNFVEGTSYSDPNHWQEAVDECGLKVDQGVDDEGEESYKEHTDIYSNIKESNDE